MLIFLIRICITNYANIVFYNYVETEQKNTYIIELIIKNIYVNVCVKSLFLLIKKRKGKPFFLQREKFFI